MTKTKGEMLKTIIERAVESGYIHKGYRQDMVANVLDDMWNGLSSNGILFSHAFAKAYFGEEEICSDCGKEFEVKDKTFPPDTYVYRIYYCDCGGDVQPSMKIAWQYHLQQAVISEDPIIYYYENYDKNTG